MKKKLKIIFSREMAMYIGVLILLIIGIIVMFNITSKLDWENRCINEVLKHEEMQDTFAWKAEELTFNERVDDDIKKMYLITTYTETNESDVIKVCTWICLVEKGNYIDCDIFNVEYVDY